MANYWGRMFGRPETIRQFEADCDEHAPDEYVEQFVKVEAGGVAFVEVSRIAIGKTIAEDEFGPWRVWRSECLGRTEGALLLITGECTEAEARAEIAAASQDLVNSGQPAKKDEVLDKPDG